MEKIRPAAPVAPWRGGKKALAARIIQHIEAIDHQCYVEPFVGMGGVFLRRSFRPRQEVANDLNGEIVNLFRILQTHYSYFLNEMRFQITSRRQFERLRETPPESLTDLQRAARFLYLQRLVFGGNTGDVFGVAADGRASRFNIHRLEPLLDAAHERLAGVVFECLDWSDIVTRYDSPKTLFYLDPPYFGGEADYGKGMFDRAQFQKMADQLREIEGAFILSINDTPEIRGTFAGFHHYEAALKYTVSSGAATEARELIIQSRPHGGDLLSAL